MTPSRVAGQMSMMEDTMDPHQMQQPVTSRILGVMSLITMVMTIPQVWVIWVDRQTAGVSLLSWGTYMPGEVGGGENGFDCAGHRSVVMVYIGKRAT
jgi:hypothetical protein